MVFLWYSNIYTFYFGFTLPVCPMQVFLMVYPMVWALRRVLWFSLMFSLWLSWQSGCNPHGCPQKWYIPSGQSSDRVFTMKHWLMIVLATMQFSAMQFSVMDCSPELVFLWLALYGWLSMSCSLWLSYGFPMVSHYWFSYELSGKLWLHPTVLNMNWIVNELWKSLWDRRAICFNFG